MGYRSFPMRAGSLMLFKDKNQARAAALQEKTQEVEEDGKRNKRIKQAALWGTGVVI